MVHFPHRPSRSQVEFALKAGVSATLALWIATAIGLEDPYWAAVSAVVATAGTLGASLGASVTRVVATLVALVFAVAVVAVVPFGGAWFSGLLVAVTLLAMFSLSLDAGARLAAGSTLIVTAASGGDPVGVAVSRGLNVPLGCAIAVVVGLVLLPRRATRQLVESLEADQAAAVRLAGRLLASYVGRDASTSDIEVDLAALTHRVGGHRATLADAAREPGSRQGVVLELDAALGGVEALMGIDVALARIAEVASADEAPLLVSDELGAVAEALERNAPLPPSLGRLDEAFAAVRERRATVTFGTEELARLLTVIRLVHNIGAVLERRPLA